MINLVSTRKYCKDHTKIEKYEEAINSSEMWECHHKLENVFTVAELKRAGWYFNRKPEELIFIRASEHNGNKDIHISFRRWYEARKGTHKSDDAKKRQADAQIGKHWYNNGLIERFAFECPEGFKPGRIR